MIKIDPFLSHKPILIIVALLLLTGALRVQAQTTGTIYGTITDPNGAAISGATVTVTSLERNLKRTTTASAEGSYKFPVLPVGKYSVAAEASGFKPIQQENIDLQVETDLRVDFKMEVGQVTERVLVTSETSQVDTASSPLGKVVEERRIVELPLNGRNFLELGPLQAGVAPPIPGIDV